MKDVLELSFWVAGILLIVAGCAGYALNVVGIIHSLGGPITALFAARIVGVFVPFIGAILGYM